MENITLDFSALARSSEATASRTDNAGVVGSWHYYQQGFVDLATENADVECWDPDPATGSFAGTLPHVCEAGWWPDPLLDVPIDRATGKPSVPVVHPNSTQPLLLELCIARAAPPGNYSGTVTVNAKAPAPSTATWQWTVPVVLEVWPILLPMTNESEAFGTAFGFDYKDLNRLYYPSLSAGALLDQWLPFLAKRRIPGDDLYMKLPRPVDVYEKLQEIGGARQVNLMSTWHCAHLSPPNCGITQGGIDYVLGVIGGFLNGSAYAQRTYEAGGFYAYGWDQSPWQAEPAVKALYRSIKAKFPRLTTAAVLDWDNHCLTRDSNCYDNASLDWFTESHGFPMDRWVTHYDQLTLVVPTADSLDKSYMRLLSDWRAQVRKTPSWPRSWANFSLLQLCFHSNAWANLHVLGQPDTLLARKGKSYWWYMMVGPYDVHAMNPVFIERPTIEGRMLFWLAALHGVDGMLYWADDYWDNECHGNTTGTIIPTGRPCKPVDRIQATMFTDWQYTPSFDATHHNNGDGSLVYPGPDGPLSSLRLEAMADGMEVATGG
jgi:hypothetical protein